MVKISSLYSPHISISKRELTKESFKSNILHKKEGKIVRCLEDDEIKTNSEIKENENAEILHEKKSKVNNYKKDLNSINKRNEIYHFMCIKLNRLFRSQSIQNLCVKTFIGSPIYIHLIFITLFFGLIGTISTLYVLSIPKTKTEINNSYFTNCSSNSDCDSLKGLQCSAQDGVCSCPAYKTKGHCDCSKGYYWSGYECRRLLQYLETGCTADYMCESYKTKYIYCINRTCQCESHKIFDTTSQKCKYHYLGCFFDWNWGYNNYFYYATSTAVIDACINACRIRSFKYTILFKSVNFNCNCASSVSFSSPSSTSCDTKCLGKDRELYPCANIWGDSNYKSVYSNF
jgi:hypothetical protein